MRIEFILDNSWLHPRPGLVGVHFQYLVHVLRKIHHHRMTHRLSSQAGTAAARQHRDLIPTRDVHRGNDILQVFGNDHADRLDLVHTGVGAIHGPGIGVEAHFPLDDLTQLFV